MSLFNAAAARVERAKRHNALILEATAHAGDPDWPPPLDEDGDGNADLAYLGVEARDRIFGPLQWAPVDGSSSQITITNDFKTKLVTVHVPQLVGVNCYGKAFKGNVTFHRAAAPALQAAFAEIEEAGLLGLVKEWGGSFNPRRIRGRDTLSNHAYGLAFDMNMTWNGLGAVPALAGAEGTVRPMVPIFQRHGFYSGIHYRSRKDGMHFEYVKTG